MKIVVLGATGALGGHVVRQALQRGDNVVAYVRKAGNLQPHDSLQVVEGELTDSVRLAKAMEGAGAIISCIGVPLGLGNMSGVDLMQRTLPNIVTATKSAGVPRFVLTSAFGVGDTANKASGFARLIYKTIAGSIFTDKAIAETKLPSSGLNWTIIYPVQLHEADSIPSTSVRPVETVGRIPGLPKLPFANVATVLLDLAADQGRSGQRLIVGGLVLA